MNTQLREYIRSCWADYADNAKLNEYGKLNVICCIGERGGKIIQEWDDDAKELDALRARVEKLEMALTAGYEVLLYQSARTRQAREWLPKDYAVIDAIAALLANAPNAAEMMESAREAWWKGNVVATRASDALTAKDGEADGG